jgi:hypothetical protein
LVQRFIFEQAQLLVQLEQAWLPVHSRQVLL